MVKRHLLHTVERQKITAYSCAALASDVKLELTLSELLWQDTKFSQTTVLLWKCGRMAEALALPDDQNTGRQGRDQI